MKPLVLAGPTASGKSALALALAATRRVTIICGDSRQLYRGMQIGAAGPTDAERDLAPHLGYGEVPTGESYDAGRFVSDTDARVDRALADGRLPIVVGGSGMYLRSWRYGLDDVPGRDARVRERLEAEVDDQGAPALHARLAELDPDSAAIIEPTDPVRVVRALEVLEVSGRPASALRRSHGAAPPRRDALWMLLFAPLVDLTPGIERRARAMFDRGLLDEALALRQVTPPDSPLLRTIGYEEVLAWSDGLLDRDEAIRRAAVRTRRYAKRQLTWFKKETWWQRLPALAPPSDLLRVVIEALDDTA